MTTELHDPATWATPPRPGEMWPNALIRAATMLKDIRAVTGRPPSPNSLSANQAIQLALGYRLSNLIDLPQPQPDVRLVAPDAEAAEAYTRLIGTLDDVKVARARRTRTFREGVPWPPISEAEEIVLMMEAALLHHLRASLVSAHISGDDFLAAVALVAVVSARDPAAGGGPIVTARPRELPDPRIVLQDRIWVHGASSWSELDDLDADACDALVGILGEAVEPWIGVALAFATTSVLIGDVGADEGREALRLLRLLTPGWIESTPLMVRLRRV